MKIFTTAATVLAASIIVAPSDAKQNRLGAAAAPADDGLPRALQTEELSSMSMPTQAAIDPDLVDVVETLKEAGVDLTSDLAIATMGMGTTEAHAPGGGYASKCLWLLHLLHKPEYSSHCYKYTSTTTTTTACAVGQVSCDTTFLGTWSGIDEAFAEGATATPALLTADLEVNFFNACPTVDEPIGTFTYSNLALDSAPGSGAYVCNGNLVVKEVISATEVKVERQVLAGGCGCNPVADSCDSGIISTLTTNCAGDQIDGVSDPYPSILGSLFNVFTLNPGPLPEPQCDGGYVEHRGLCCQSGFSCNLDNGLTQIKVVTGHPDAQLQISSPSDAYTASGCNDPTIINGWTKETSGLYPNDVIRDGECYCLCLGGGSTIALPKTYVGTNNRYGCNQYSLNTDADTLINGNVLDVSDWFCEATMGNIVNGMMTPAAEEDFQLYGGESGLKNDDRVVFLKDNSCDSAKLAWQASNHNVRQSCAFDFGSWCSTYDKSLIVGNTCFP